MGLFVWGDLKLGLAIKCCGLTSLVFTTGLSGALHILKQPISRDISSHDLPQKGTCTRPFCIVSFCHIFYSELVTPPTKMKSHGITYPLHQELINVTVFPFLFCFRVV